MSIRRSIIVLILIVIALPLVVFGARANMARQESAAAQTASGNIQQYVVIRGAVEVTITAIGRVEADQVAQLSFPNAGRVTELPFETGSTVIAGDVVARQDDTNARTAYEQALLALDLVTIQRDQLLVGPDEGQIAIAQANLDAAEAAAYAVQNAVTADDIRAAELSYQASQRAVEDAIRARSTAPGGQPEAYYALLDARVGELTFTAETARLQLESLRTADSGQVGAAYARVQQAERDLERLQAGANTAELDRAEILISQAQLNVEAAQVSLNRAALTTPFDGVISAVNVEVGTLAVPGVTVVEISDYSPLRLRVQVDEIDIRQVREGLPARVRLDALPDVSFDATINQIALISGTQDGIVSYDVDVLLNDVDDPRVRVGMTAEASVVVESVADVVIVPNLYIRLDREDNRAYVNLVRGTDENVTLEEVEVTLGLQGEDSSEILSGLREGDVIGVDLAGDSINLFGG